MKKSNIYTRTGDLGTTALVDGTRTAKYSIRLEAYGTIDELNSTIGLLLATPGCPDSAKTPLTEVQHRLFDIGSYLACAPEGEIQLPPGVDTEDIARLEKAIDETDAGLPRHNQFILPSGTQSAAQAHVARTVCRRAERRILALNAESPVAPHVIAYINRLSDYLFTVGRLCNIESGKPEIFWQKK